MGEVPGLVCCSCVDVSWKKRTELGDVEWNPLEGFEGFIAELSDEEGE